MLPDFSLAADVPDVELEAVGLDRLDVEALGRGDRRDVFTKNKFLYYRKQV